MAIVQFIETQDFRNASTDINFYCGSRILHAD